MDEARDSDGDLIISDFKSRELFSPKVKLMLNKGGIFVDVRFVFYQYCYKIL